MPNKFNPMKARLRATFAAGATKEPRLERVDREKEVLHGVQITLEGEARGHGVWLDRAFCEAVAEAGNAMGDAGVKVRFGHPSMCSDALGTYLGRAKNFRVVDLERKEAPGEKVAGVLADVYIAAESHSAPSGDLGKWVLDAAENSPDTFGQSIVFTYADLKSTNADGEPIMRSEYEDDRAFNRARGENKVFAVLGKLRGTDFTDTPAATDGVFSAGDLAAEAEEMLASHPAVLSAIEGNPEKVIEFLDRAGLLSLIETKRVAGLQAAKDKQIAELNEMLAVRGKGFEEALAKEAGAHQAEIAALNAEIERLKTGNVETTKALDAANAEIKQLKEDGEKAATALSETKAALAAETERYRKQVGLALQPAEELPTLQEGLAKCSTPAEKSAFIASGKYKKDEKERKS